MALLSGCGLSIRRVCFLACLLVVFGMGWVSGCSCASFPSVARRCVGSCVGLTTLMRWARWMGSVRCCGFVLERMRIVFADRWLEGSVGLSWGVLLVGTLGRFVRLDVAEFLLL